MLRQSLFRFVNQKNLLLLSQRSVYRSALDNSDKIAVIDSNGRYSYSHLLSASVQLRDKLLSVSNEKQKSANKRIAFLCNPDASFVVAQWTCWLSRATCIPLCKDHPQALLDYYIDDSKCSHLIVSPEYENILRPLADKFQIPLIILTNKDLELGKTKNVLQSSNQQQLDIFSKSSDDALILYTSGTTGKPKGVVHTIATLRAQMDAMLYAWRLTKEDTILNVLPLHHVHGMINCVMSPLYAGGTVVMMNKFDAEQTWDHLLNDKDPPINVFSAVPTIYIKLIEHIAKSSKNKDVKKRCSDHMRLFLSGSAALPESTFQKWHDLTGFEIVEQFGSSETGRVLSNKLDGKKLAGRVGLPMPDLTVRLVQKDEQNNDQIVAEGTYDKVKILQKEHDGKVQGEMYVKGPALFKYYFNKEEATRKAFDSQGYYMMGDMAEYDKDNNTFRILGRSSVDIIKSGGYKISALDIETVILHHPLVSECVVIGVKDLEWGERVTAIIVLQPGKKEQDLTLEQLRDYCKKKLPGYQCPTQLKVVDKLERNAVGKVNKKELNDTSNKRHTQLGVLCPNDVSFVVAMWASWMAGATVVPLSSHHPPSSLAYFLTDAQCRGVIVGDDKSNELIKSTLKSNSLMDLPIININQKNLSTKFTNQDVNDDLLLSTTTIDRTERSNALIVYTSGTSGKPKGCVLTFDTVQAHVDSMIKAWRWTKDDVILHVLPLHHVHGLINALLTPLYIGATTIMLPHFDASKVWEYLVHPGFEQHITVFTAVPTIYSKLIKDHETKLASRPQTRDFVREQCSQMIRLMMCGSAALPESIHRRWYEITGHNLLERYGMTECGMALTNPLNGERIPGTVGRPMPGVVIRITKENASSPMGYDILVEADSDNTKVEVQNTDEPIEGELYIQSPTLFKEYWQKRNETRATFTADGTFFKTGDICRYDSVKNVFSIRGRQSMDIIKRAGYKISALDIERVLLEHKNISECSVVGMDDPTLGQKIVAIIVPKSLNNIKDLTIDTLRQYSKQSLPSYSLPDSITILDHIPRNAMGKVNKKELVRLVV
ncbi:hypothetical protein I4U23_028276 [Adineta vaga]|nr:hypothetical protein I4U23_028276 [Adineta vaga]